MSDEEIQSADMAEEARRQHEAREIQNALRGLRFGSVNVIVQDGIVVQIDRVEKNASSAQAWTVADTVFKLSSGPFVNLDLSLGWTALCKSSITQSFVEVGSTPAGCSCRKSLDRPLLYPSHGDWRRCCLRQSVPNLIAIHKVDNITLIGSPEFVRKVEPNPAARAVHQSGRSVRPHHIKHERAILASSKPKARLPDTG